MAQPDRVFAVPMKMTSEPSPIMVAAGGTGESLFLGGMGLKATVRVRALHGADAASENQCSNTVVLDQVEEAVFIQPVCHSVQKFIALFHDDASAGNVARSCGEEAKHGSDALVEQDVEMTIQTLEERDQQILWAASEPEEWRNRIVYLPVRMKDFSACPIMS